MKYLFLVQGEGRGHMTQAIELANLLTSNGHEVVYTFIGKSNRRSVPDYFREKIPSEIEALPSPNFVLDKDNKSLNLFKSISHNLRFLNRYRKSLRRINQIVNETSPHAIINFYDILGGFYFRIHNPRGVKHICVGRQFLTFHPNYLFEKRRETEKNLFLLNNKITSQRCDKYMALSFRPHEPVKFKNVVVCPPLLKDEVKHIQPSTEDFILGYMVNDGYAEEIMDMHRNTPDVKMHCFWDRKNMPESYSPQPNLTFHQLNNELFTDMMKRCKGYISTAGFESVCEAMYLKKPIMMSPVEGQYEQACNALDAEVAGAGIKADSFNISNFIDFIPNYEPNEQFKSWTSKTESIFLEELTNF